VVSRAGAEEVLMDVLRGVLDPEVPALDIVELGIVRKVELGPDGVVAVEVTPTYSGCPAMRTIEEEIVAALGAKGYDRVELRTVFSPAWTTDWMSDSAKAKLKAYGIAPPGHTGVAEQALVPLVSVVRHAVCPFCSSSNTERKSEFGSTACKAIHYCHGCHQPFEEFKAI
jgi:ring-1,2-phenylacetyl-CoA epoxidase subunit PaaD